LLNYTTKKIKPRKGVLFFSKNFKKTIDIVQQTCYNKNGTLWGRKILAQTTKKVKTRAANGTKTSVNGKPNFLEKSSKKRLTQSKR